MKEMNNNKIVELHDSELAKVSGGRFPDRDYERIQEYIYVLWDEDERDKVMFLEEMLEYYDSLPEEYSYYEFMDLFDSSKPIGGGVW